MLTETWEYLNAFLVNLSSYEDLYYFLGN